MSQPIVNNFTTQKPLTVYGQTGNQVLTMIPASRVFVKISDSITAAPVSAYGHYSFKTNGKTPAGWSDLGVMDGPAKMVYNKTVEKVQTGMDKVTRRTYAKSKEASLEFSLWQTDDLVLSLLGFNGSVVTAGSSMSFLIGQEDVIEVALLCVYCNKVDGKEMHVYHPNASLAVTFDSASDKMVVKVVADLTAFTPENGSVDALYCLNLFASTGALIGNAPTGTNVSSGSLIVLPSSANPMIDLSTGKTFEMLLTGSTAPTFSNVSPGEIYTFIWVQDYLGGHALTYPASVLNATPVNPDANMLTIQMYRGTSAGTLQSLDPAVFSPA